MVYVHKEVPGSPDILQVCRENTASQLFVGDVLTNITSQQNLTHGSPLRARLDRVRARVLLRGRARTRSHRVLDLRTHVQGVRS